jgi:cytidylate kinase-like protein
MAGSIGVITVSRQYGAGGGDFAALLGNALGWPVHDRFISEQAAERLAAPPETITSAEERESTYLERLEQLFSMGTPETIIGMAPARPWNQQVFNAERDTIVRLAESPPAVIVGRGAQCILRGRPGIVHVRIYAPVQERITRIAARTGKGPGQAAAAVKRMDAVRGKFLSGHFGCGEEEDTLYDVELNTSTVSLEEGVELVRALVERRRA